MTKITDVVAALREMEKGDRPTDQREIRRRLRERCQGINPSDDEIIHAFNILADEADEEMRVATAEYRRNKRDIAECLELLEGLPAPTTLAQAIAIKAQQGYPLALRWQRAMNGKDYRLSEALGDAAHNAHPQFEQTPDGSGWHWTGDGEMPSEEAMIDWFQLTHPAEALRIEREICETRPLASPSSRQN